MGNLIVRCTTCINAWTGRPYKYLRKGGEYKVEAITKSSKNNPLYLIRTPRGLTHYPQRLFQITELQYDPSQTGDTDDDI